MKRVSTIPHPKDTSIALVFLIDKNRRDIVFYPDIFSVTKLLFYESKSGKINFIHKPHLCTRNMAHITSEINKDIGKYTEIGFVVTDIHADNDRAPK